ncbi:MAG: hypothetical protein KBF98_04755 [Rhodoferax sp.]|nr:hypothetical protein [Rhodoferax sp.]MBP9059606.1 hypothetical protein [Rhodoferax sp.]
MKIWLDAMVSPLKLANEVQVSAPVIAPSKAATSATVITDGMRLGRVGRCTSSSHGNFNL